MVLKITANVGEALYVIDFRNPLANSMHLTHVEEFLFQTTTKMVVKFSQNKTMR